MVPHRAALRFRHRVKVANQFFDGLAGAGVAGGFDRAVKHVDIGGVVLVVVDFHRARVDVGLKRVEGVRQVRDFKAHYASGRRNCRAI